MTCTFKQMPSNWRVFIYPTLWVEYPWQVITPKGKNTTTANLALSLCSVLFNNVIWDIQYWHASCKLVMFHNVTILYMWNNYLTLTTHILVWEWKYIPMQSLLTNTVYPRLLQHYSSSFYIYTQPWNIGICKAQKK